MTDEAVNWIEENLETEDGLSDRMVVSNDDNKTEYIGVENLADLYEDAILSEGHPLDVADFGDTGHERFFDQ